MQDAQPVEAITQDAVALVLEPREPHGHPGDRVCYAPVRVVDEVVVLDLAEGDDLGVFLRIEETNADARAQGERLGRLEKDAARRNVARDAAEISEQDRLDADRKNLVEPQVFPLVAGGRGWQRGGCAGGVTHDATLPV